jgi:hypothetical protein
VGVIGAIARSQAELKLGAAKPRPTSFVRFVSFVA